MSSAHLPSAEYEARWYVSASEGLQTSVAAVTQRPWVQISCGVSVFQIDGGWFCQQASHPENDMSKLRYPRYLILGVVVTGALTTAKSTSTGVAVLTFYFSLQTLCEVSVVFFQNAAVYIYNK